MRRSWAAAILVKPPTPPKFVAFTRQILDSVPFSNKNITLSNHSRNILVRAVAGTSSRSRRRLNRSVGSRLSVDAGQPEQRGRRGGREHDDGEWRLPRGQDAAGQNAGRACPARESMALR
jgi:hypothetical protein